MCMILGMVISYVYDTRNGNQLCVNTTNGNQLCMILEMEISYVYIPQMVISCV